MISGVKRAIGGKQTKEFLARSSRSTKAGRVVRRGLERGASSAFDAVGAAADSMSAVRSGLRRKIGPIARKALRLARKIKKADMPTDMKKIYLGDLVSMVKKKERGRYVKTAAAVAAGDRKSVV